ncbi:hypothetical protein [Streptomyces filipinensis]|nr:hypothetical protein [Streptomyces filipinensis]
MTTALTWVRPGHHDVTGQSGAGPGDHPQSFRSDFGSRSGAGMVVKVDDF